MGSNLIFSFRYSNSEVEEKSTSNLPYDMKPSGPSVIFFLLEKNDSDRGAFKVPGYTFWSNTSQCKTSLYSEMAGGKLLET